MSVNGDMASPHRITSEDEVANELHTVFCDKDHHAGECGWYRNEDDGTRERFLKAANLMLEQVSYGALRPMLSLLHEVKFVIRPFLENYFED